jgi:hypothetical protein
MNVKLEWASQNYMLLEVPEAQQRHVVTACNHHEELLNACKTLLAKERTMTTGALYQEFRDIEAILQKIEKGE